MGKEGAAEAWWVLWQMTMSDLSEKAEPDHFREYQQTKVRKEMKRKRAVVAPVGKACELIYYCPKEGELYSYKPVKHWILRAA